MKVRVLMFGAMAEAAQRADTLDLADGARVDDVLAALRDRYPFAGPILDRCCVAVNEEVVDGSCPVGEADEIAVLPPMSGGVVWVRLSQQPAPDEALAAVAAPSAGGTVTFTGTVRDVCDLGPVDALEYSAYEAMAVKVMRQVAEEAAAKWSLLGAAIDHAVGMRTVGEITFVVVCAATGRVDAFDACRYVVEEVKRRVPIWKREIGPWGSRWVGL